MCKNKDLLTDREIQVLRKVKEGFTNNEIANQLYVSEKTIKFHCTNIYKKLGISGRRSFFHLFLTG